MAKALYICYFGVDEPLVQTQVIPYLRELVKGGHEISLLTFEPGEVDEAAVRGVLGEDGIDWHWLTYHKRFSVIATAWDIFRGTWFIRSFIAREKPEILHGRVHVPTLMGALARKFSRHKPKLLFDIRGFFPEEYTDAGVWPENGILYRTAKRVEKWLLKEADGFVVLTEKARTILFAESKDSGRDKYGRPVEVIPCCVDLSRFGVPNPETRSFMRAKLGAGDRRVITYVGSFGGWYLSEEMVDLFSTALKSDPNTFIMVLTQRDHEKIVAKLESRGIERSNYFVGSVKPAELPQYLAAADTAISFIKACYSKQSSSPTKIAEYLASGLPIISNRGVGDVDDLIENNGVGALIDDFSSVEYDRALKAVAGRDVSEMCRETASREFDLEQVAGSRYRRLYRALLSKDDQDAT